MQSAVDKVNARLEDLRSDEERQRANVTALASADKDPPASASCTI
jgi:hypothetical protein